MTNLRPPALYFGGDYNPEQWPQAVWEEDVRLMRRAGVNLVTLGVFSWANLEHSEGVFHFEWLDEIFDLLDSNGIGIDLATATASPPAWLVTKYPEVLPVTESGVRLSHGGRQAYCPSSPIYKALAVRLATKLAQRYGKHPALKMWHVNNEYGCHNPHCYCDISAESFRSWLKRKYETLDELNLAWGTNFWSQRYNNWEEISPPRQTPSGTFPNPGQSLDFHRFSNAEILELFKSERDAIRKIDSAHPITTNFMSMKHSKFINYWQWAREVDFVSTDHYLIAEDPENYIELAFQADLTRGFAAGKPWLLMEHSTSGVNWQNVNLAKGEGELLRNSLSHIARGSDGAMFFQWRASISGSEKFHSAMVPHAGTETRIFRSVEKLGSLLSKLPELAGTETQPAQVAMIFDYESFWALSQRNLPSDQMSYPDVAHDWYRALWHSGVRVDFLPPDAPLELLAKYGVILVPMLYLMPDDLEQRLIDYSHFGTLVVSYFSGISDSSDRVKLGGYGGRLVREALGVRVEEFSPLKPGEEVALSNGMAGSIWSEFSQTLGAEVLAEFSSGLSIGSVAIAKHRNNSSPSYYLATRLGQEALREFFNIVLGDLGIPVSASHGVEVITRGPYDFFINHTDVEVEMYFQEELVTAPSKETLIRKRI